jgi:hypothetical protein
MEPKSKLGVPIHSSPELRLRDKRQTSEEELEEVRKRGHYLVLPPIEDPQEEDWDNRDDWPALIL